MNSICYSFSISGVFSGSHIKEKSLSNLLLYGINTIQLKKKELMTAPVVQALYQVWVFYISKLWFPSSRSSQPEKL